MKHIQSIGYLLAVGFTLCGLTACRGGGIVDDIVRNAPKPKPNIPVDDVPVPRTNPPDSSVKDVPILNPNHGNRRTYKITDVQQSVDESIATVDTIDGIYQIAVDCQTGVLSPKGVIQPDETVNFIRDVCNSVAGQPSGESDSQVH